MQGQPCWDSLQHPWSVPALGPLDEPNLHLHGHSGVGVLRLSSSPCPHMALPGNRSYNPTGTRVSRAQTTELRPARLAQLAAGTIPAQLTAQGAGLAAPVLGRPVLLPSCSSWAFVLHPKCSSTSRTHKEPESHPGSPAHTSAEVQA